jgi:hypothetical protein
MRVPLTSPSFRRKPESIFRTCHIVELEKISAPPTMDSGLRRNDDGARASQRRFRVGQRSKHRRAKQLARLRVVAQISPDSIPTAPE